LIKTLLEIVESPSNQNVSQTIQILTNLGAYEDSINQLEKTIAETRRTHKGISMRLKAKGMIHDSISKVQHVSSLLIHRKIDDFIDFSDIDGFVSLSFYLFIGKQHKQHKQHKQQRNKKTRKQENKKARKQESKNRTTRKEENTKPNQTKK
jgi:hypothetical protein